MRKRINVLFTAVCGWPTHATVNALRESKEYDYTIVGVDCNPNPFALNYVDFLYKVPRCTDHDYLSEIKRICEKHNINIIIPLISEEIGIYFAHMKEFDNLNIKILLSDENSLLNIANDKFELQKFLEAKGIHVMPKTKPLCKETLESDLKEFGYPENPVAVKLKDGCGGVGFKILDDNIAKNVGKLNSRASRVNPYITKEQLLNLDERRYLLQTYLSGDELGVLSLVDHGRTMYAICHDNYDMQYATTTDCELVKNVRAETIVERINSLLGLDGNIGYDFKRDENGNLYLLEINPRISATVSLAVKGGVNIVEMGVLHKLGYQVDENLTPLYGLRMKRVYGSLFTYEGKPYE